MRNLEKLAQELKDKRNTHEKDIYTKLINSNVPPTIAKKAKSWGKDKIRKELGIDLQG